MTFGSHADARFYRRSRSKRGHDTSSFRDSARKRLNSGGGPRVWDADGELYNASTSPSSPSDVRCRFSLVNANAFPSYFRHDRESPPNATSPAPVATSSRQVAFKFRLSKRYKVERAANQGSSRSANAVSIAASRRAAFDVCIVAIYTISVGSIVNKN